MAGAIALLTKTPTEFESAVPSLFLDIALDGLILYDKQNYAHNHLHYLRQLLRKRGYLATKKGANSYGNGKHSPATTGN
ncbi:MAG: hypothetical protein IPL28_15285 [Chloroflexi bacterium]|nr:hypothetical protein [Chloroflexota bacterium]